MNPSEKRTTEVLPTLGVLVDAADAALHLWVHDHVPEVIRRAALAEELGFWLHTAARDMEFRAGDRG